MRFYHDNSEIRHGADTREVGIGFQDKIVCGKFVDEERPTFREMMDAHYTKTWAIATCPWPRKEDGWVSRTEIRITGFGGQGVILAGHIIGRACAVEGGQHATMIQSFGPEARGSACSATLTVSRQRGALSLHHAGPTSSSSCRRRGTRSTPPS